MLVGGLLGSRHLLPDTIQTPTKIFTYFQILYRMQIHNNHDWETTRRSYCRNIQGQGVKSVKLSNSARNKTRHAALLLLLHFLFLPGQQYLLNDDHLHGSTEKDPNPKVTEWNSIPIWIFSFQVLHPGSILFSKALLLHIFQPSSSANQSIPSFFGWRMQPHPQNAQVAHITHNIKSRFKVFILDILRLMFELHFLLWGWF